jgi:intraflagellar transport protein 74
MRQGTSANTAGESGFVAVGDGTEVNVQDRPVTNHGLTGLKTSAQGPGRRV